MTLFQQFGKWMVVAVFAAVILMSSANALAQNMQCIFSGSVRYEGEIPAFYSMKINLLKGDSSLVRQAFYNPVTGVYGVSAFESDGFQNGDPVMFQVEIQPDSVSPVEKHIAHTWGNTATYEGGFPPVDKQIDLTNNRAPSTFLLIMPGNGDTVHLTTNPLPIQFIWTTASDSDGDPLRYTLYVKGLLLDSMAAGLSDTVHAMNLIPKMEVSSMYKWWVNVTDGYETVSSDTFSLFSSDTITAVEEYRNGVPTEFALGQNFPNPFNPSTVIQFQLPVESNVKLTVFNMLGQEVAKLVEETQSAGYKSVKFDASSAKGGLPSGIYLYKLTTNTFTQVKKMLVLK